MKLCLAASIHEDHDPARPRGRAPPRPRFAEPAAASLPSDRGIKTPPSEVSVSLGGFGWALLLRGAALAARKLSEN